MSDQNSNSIENFVTEPKCVWKDLNWSWPRRDDNWCLAANSNTANCYTKQECLDQGCNPNDCQIYNNRSITLEIQQ